MKRGVIGVLGEISIYQYKAAMTTLINGMNDNVVWSDTETLAQNFEIRFMAYSVRNHKNQQSVLCNWRRLSGAIKAKRLNEIKRADIENELNKLRDRGLSNASQNRVLALLKKQFNLALADELITSSPAKYIKALKEEHVPSIALPDAVFKRYIELAFNADHIVHGMALVLTATTGCRIGEVMGVRLNDIAPDCHSFLIRDTKNRTTRKVMVGTHGAKAIKKAMQLSFNSFLFSSERSLNGFISYPVNTHKLIVTRLKEEFNMVNHIQIKDLRSTVATKIYERTGDIKAVQVQLGHKDIAVTSSRYLHPSETKQMEVVSTIDELID